MTNNTHNNVLQRPMVLEALIAEVIAYGSTYKRHLLGQQPANSRNRNKNIFNSSLGCPNLQLYTREDLSNYIKNTFFYSKDTELYVCGNDVLNGYNKSHNVSLTFNPTKMFGGNLYRPHDDGHSFFVNRRKSSRNEWHLQTRKKYRDTPAISPQALLQKYAIRLDDCDWLNRGLQRLVRNRMLDHFNYSNRPFKYLDWAGLTSTYDAPPMETIKAEGLKNRDMIIRAHEEFEMAFNYTETNKDTDTFAFDELVNTDTTPAKKVVYYSLSEHCPIRFAQKLQNLLTKYPPSHSTLRL